MRIPLKIPAKSVKYHDEAGSEISGFIHFEEHTRDDTGNRMEKAVKQSTVFKEKVTKVFINGKNAMAVLDINKFKRHGSSTFHGILVSTGRAKTAVTSEWDKFKLTTMRTAIHGTTKRRITTVDHLIDIFHLSISGMKSIFNFFIVVGKDFLQNVHATIMQEI